MEFLAAKEYTQSPCGLTIYPQVPWLGSSPDGLLYDPSVTPSYVLVQIKCPNVKSYIDCLQMWNDAFKAEEKPCQFLASTVQGQLDITGLEGCDFFVWAGEDFFVWPLHNCRVGCSRTKKTEVWVFLLSSLNETSTADWQVKKSYSDALLSWISNSWLNIMLFLFCPAPHGSQTDTFKSV